MSVQSSVNSTRVTRVARVAMADKSRAITLGGATAGLAGAAAMAGVGALFALWQGDGIWLTARQISTVVLGDAAAAQAGFAATPVMVGTLIHILTSAVLGVIFAWLVSHLFHETDYGIPVVSGLIYGLAIWLVAYFVVLPIVSPQLLNTYAPGFIIQNIVYGTVLGLMYQKLGLGSYLEPEAAEAPAS